MVKKTKRKAFNFLRSYFDVFNELKTDKDKLDFLTAIINKQFLDEDPKELSFIVNLCYESQRHQIETSVKGWLRATKDTLGTTHTTPLGTIPTTDPKEEEEEVKEEEQEEVKEESNNIESIDFNILLEYFNNSFGKASRVVNDKVKKAFNARLKEGYTKHDFKKCIDNLKNDSWHKENDYKYCTLEFISRSDKLDKWTNVTNEDKSNKSDIDILMSNIIV